MKPLAMIAVLFAIAACDTGRDDAAVVDTAAPVIAPAPADTGFMRDTLRDTARTPRTP